MRRMTRRELTVDSDLVDVPAGPCRYRNSKLTDIYASSCSAPYAEVHTPGPLGLDTSNTLMTMPDILMMNSNLEVNNEPEQMPLYILLTRSKRPLLFR